MRVRGPAHSYKSPSSHIFLCDEVFVAITESSLSKRPSIRAAWRLCACGCVLVPAQVDVARTLSPAICILTDHNNIGRRESITYIHSLLLLAAENYCRSLVAVITCVKGTLGQVDGRTVVDRESSGDWENKRTILMPPGVALK